MALALALVALILGVIELVRSKASSLIAWAITALALALVWPVSRLLQ
jgi:hypothetical protein